MKSSCQGYHGRLVLFDLLALGGRWLGDEPAEKRLSRLERFWSEHGAGLSRIELVRCERTAYPEVFRSTASIPGAEGVVLKARRQPLHRARDGCAVNPSWLKVKRP
jgi:ATP-dependent DNA ligase